MFSLKPSVQLTVILSMCVLLFITLLVKESKAMVPSGMDFNDSTTCEEFSRYARFNPYSVLGEWWFMFYYWAQPTGQLFFYFYVPPSSQVKYIHEVLDEKVTIPVNWTARHFILSDQYHATHLLVERSDRGEYWMYTLSNDMIKKKKKKVTPLDMRFKQTGDNKYLAIMDCKHDSVYVFSKLKHLPRKNDIPDVVAKIGYRGRRGRTYLYQGHEWMPIPEMDELYYWMPPKLKQKFSHLLKQ